MKLKSQQGLSLTIVVRFVYIFICLLTFTRIQAKSFITYQLYGGRLGDKLVCYCHAKWVSYKYDIPFLYRPFEYSDQFIMHTSDMTYLETQFESDRKVTIDKNIVIDPDADIVYEFPYFPESHFEPEFHHSPFLIDWNDKGFLDEIRRVLKPHFAMTPPLIPAGLISVAVHVRKGTGFDDPRMPQVFPHKAPPDSYYIEQIRRIADMFHDQSLYIYIFTDHDCPIDLVNQYKKRVGRKNLTFACRESGNKHNKNVVEDFISLTCFDCLIRPDSNFSLIASKLCDYKVQISPHHISGAVIDKVKIEVHSKNGSLIEII